MAARPAGQVLFYLCVGDIKKLQVFFGQLLQGNILGKTIRMPTIDQFSIGVFGIFIRCFRGQPQGFIVSMDSHRPMIISQVQSIYKVRALAGTKNSAEHNFQAPI